MYLKHLLATLLICLFNLTGIVNAQDLQLSKTFTDREVIASPDIKSRLTTQRKLISDQKLGFLVGATEVSSVNMEYFVCFHYRIV